VAPQNTALFSRRYVPQSYCPIRPGRRDDIAGGGERDGIDAAVMPLEGKLLRRRGPAATAGPRNKQKRAQQMKRRDKHLSSGKNTHCLDLLIEER
jgi:hypothetical protein